MSTDTDTPEPEDVIADLADACRRVADRRVRPLPTPDELLALRRVDR